MAVESNINMYYEELIASMAERALDDIEDDVDETDAINQAIDDGLMYYTDMYYTDQAYIIAHALQNGFIEWGGEVEWDAIFEDLYADVSAELEELRKEQDD